MNDPIAESNEKQSQFYEANPGAFDAYRWQDEGDHPCNADDDGCCSICGTDAARLASEVEQFVDSINPYSERTRRELIAKLLP